jgi:hypothetical protein
MSFTTHNTAPIECEGGTWLQGVLTAKYQELVDLFGKPGESDGYKVDAEWRIRFEDGVIATVYNWKDGKNYCGKDGTPTEQIESWHIGGTSTKAVDRVQIALDLHRETKVEQKREKQDDVTKAFQNAKDVMDTIRANRGDGYAHAVEASMLIMKKRELFMMLTTSLVECEIMPKPVAEVLTKTDAMLDSKIIGLICKHADMGSEKEDAEELIDWAKRLMQLEQKGAEILFKHLKKDCDD